MNYSENQANPIFHRIIEDLPEIFFELDPTGNLIYANKFTFAFLEYSPKELLNKKVDQLPIFNHSEQLLVGEKVQYIANGGAPPSRNYTVYTKSGKSHIVRLSTRTYQKTNNEKGICGIMVNVTAEYESKQALFDQRFKSESLIQYSSDIIMLLNSDGAPIYHNQTFEKIFGYTLLERTGKSALELVHPKDLPRIRQLFGELISTPEKVVIAEYRIRTKKGDYIEIESTAANHLNTPAIRGVVLNSRNISKRKVAERALEEKERKYRALVEAAPSPILIIDKTGKITNCNSATTEFYGYTATELIGANILTISTATSKKKLRSYLQHLLKHEVLTIEIETQRKNGFTFLANVKAKLIQTDNRDILIFVYIQDISKYKAAENALITAKEKAEEADQLKSAFLANMSHEIRTPMNAILGFSELLKDHNITKEEQHEFIEIINLSGANLLHIINDIIDISRIEANQVNISLGECNLNALLSDLELFFNTHLQQKGKEGITLSIHSEFEDEKANTYTDQGRLHQILLNLINNAIKFTNHGKIEFGYQVQDDKTLIFYVKDTGIGIPKDQQESIFERFKQVDESTTRSYGGTGLGLSISKAFVELLGGTIWLESIPREGSSFYFTHPYHPVLQGQFSQIKTLPDNINWNSSKILIVEDDPLSLKLLHNMLHPTGVQIISASTGDEAITLYKRHKNTLNLILMDIQLPGISGYDLTRMIRRSNPLIPVIIQSANAMSSHRHKGMLAGCTDYLTKPIRKSTLLKKLKFYL